MASEGNCTSGPKVDLASYKRSSTASDSSQIREEVVDCQAETKARPLCMRGKMTRDEVTFGNDFTLGFVAHNINAWRGYSVLEIQCLGIKYVPFNCFGIFIYWFWGRISLALIWPLDTGEETEIRDVPSGAQQGGQAVPGPGNPYSQYQSKMSLMFFSTIWWYSLSQWLGRLTS